MNGKHKKDKGTSCAFNTSLTPPFLPFTAGWHSKNVHGCEFMRELITLTVPRPCAWECQLLCVILVCLYNCIMQLCDICSFSPCIRYKSRCILGFVVCCTIRCGQHLEVIWHYCPTECLTAVFIFQADHFRGHFDQS